MSKKRIAHSAVPSRRTNSTRSRESRLLHLGCARDFVAGMSFVGVRNSASLIVIFRFYDACQDVALNTNGPRTVGGVLRVPGLIAGSGAFSEGGNGILVLFTIVSLGMVKISSLYKSKSLFCGNFSLLNVGGCHTDRTAELLTEEGDQMPGVPYRIDYAFPRLDFTAIPKRNPNDRPQYDIDRTS